MVRPVYKGIIASAVSLVLVSSIAVGLALWKLRDDAIADSVRETQNLAAILAEQANRSSQAVELVLDEIIAEVRRRDVVGPDDFESQFADKVVFDYLKERLARLSQADVIGFTDRTGRMLTFTRAWPTPPLDLSDRDYFRHGTSSRDLGLFVSEPVQNRVTGAWTVYFSKRLESADGQFLGLAMIGVRPEYFLRAFDVISSIPGRSMMLLRADGTVLLRYPDPIDRTGFRLPEDSEWYRLPPQGGSFRSPSVFDGRSRLIAVHPTHHYPMAVNVAVAEEQALASWRTRAIVIGICSFLVELAFAVLLFVLYRQFDRVHESEAKLREKSEEIGLANARFDAALTNMSHGIAIFDRDGHRLVHNRMYEEIWGGRQDAVPLGRLTAPSGPYRPADVYGTSSVLLVDRQEFRRREHITEVQALPDGRSVRVTVDPMPDGGWVTTYEDITESQRANDRIAHMAHYDSLTGLANRALFMSQLADCIAGVGQREYAVLLLDLDHFKEVNDTYGHGTGDALLREVADRLSASVRADDLVARLGGDEFAIVIDMEHAAVTDILHLAERILAAIDRPYWIDGNEIAIGLSIGITVAQAGSNDPESIMRQADLALYRSKADGRARFHVFEHEMEEEYRSRQSLILDLQTAIGHDELAVHYQPIVDAATLEIRTMEALARWSHPTHGMVPPSLFVPLAEEAGLIHQLGEWVLTRACHDAMAWPAAVKVAVNVSTIQISQSSFPDIVARVLHETGLAPHRLLLEITESVLLSDTTRAMDMLHALNRLGASIVLDDFGTGYSSLSYLKQFPFDEIKIDKSFIDDIAGHRGCAAIVSATTTLAREFDMVTTAEGVETPEQYHLLRAASVGQMQGYLFGKPAPAAHWVDFTAPKLRPGDYEEAGKRQTVDV